MKARRVTPILFLLLTACGRYADFRLPPPDSSGPRAPFNWQANPTPVLLRENSSDVLNPSVIKFHGEYLNLYSEFDGKKWHTALAVSSDGIAWQKRGRVLSPEGWEGNYIAANGSALVSGDEVFYWYEAGDPFQTAFAKSRDGREWRKHGPAVLGTGPYGSFDERGVSDPYVIRAGDFFYLYYTGLDRARRQRLGVARSRDGVEWEKLRSNPILEMGAPGAFDEMGLGEPAVWSSGGFYWMLYTGRARGERRHIGLARSSDGVQWERDSSFLPIAGSEEWDREVVCDPTVEVTPEGIRVWFGGGDVARPDENLYGQIGVGWLKPR
jgi:predicted GH43/DUF377 family glycosyl hydrolase